MSTAKTPTAKTKSCREYWPWRKAFFEEANDSFCKEDFTEFCLAFEETTPLEFHEIGALVPALKLVLLEQIAARGSRLVNDPLSNPITKSSQRVTTYIRTFRHVTQTSWKDELESLIPFDRILREDPAGAYVAMDLESRNVYRERVAQDRPTLAIEQSWK